MPPPTVCKYFASHPDRCVAMRIRASHHGAISCDIRLSAQVPHHVKGSNGDQLTMTGHAVGDEANTIHFCTLLKAVCNGGTCTTTDWGAAEGSVSGAGIAAAVPADSATSPARSVARILSFFISLD